MVFQTGGEKDETVPKCPGLGGLSATRLSDEHGALVVAHLRLATGDRIWARHPIDRTTHIIWAAV